MKLFAKLRNAIHAIGVGNSCLYVATRLLAGLFGNRVRIVKYYFMAQPVTAPDDEAAAKTGAFSLVWADATSPLFSQVDRPAATISARFAQGARCLAAVVDGSELAGFVWFVIGPYEEDEVRARFVPAPEGESAWDFDVTILPRYRMGRLFSYLWRRAGAELAARGVKHTISRISAFNGPSLASHRRLGARHVGAALFICIGRWQLMKASCIPRWRLSWRNDQRPVLAIAA